ncbi:hypothetical protein GBAR_LOCUS3293, partial [Geodia barretti]
CVSIPHLTVSSSHTVGCSPCCSLAPVYHQLSLEHGHHKQSSPPHHTSPAVCFYNIINTSTMRQLTCPFKQNNEYNRYCDDKKCPSS